MIKHIVMWRLKKEAMGASKEKNAIKLKEMLEALMDEIPEALYIEAGINLNNSKTAADIVLYSEFESMEDLEAYHKHPAHLEVGKFVERVVDERHVVDYED